MSTVNISPAQNLPKGDFCNDNIRIPAELLQTFCLKWHVRELALFGSVLRDDFHSDSDIDMMVKFSDDACPTLFDLVYMEQELQQLLHRKIDLVSRKGIESSQNYLRRDAILSSSQVIYGS